MELRKSITTTIREYLNESQDLDIKKMYGWYSSFKDRYYKDVETAYNDIKQVVERNNKQLGKIFGEDKPDDIINLFNFIETQKGVKIKPKLKPPKKTTNKNNWDDFDIMKTPLDELHLIANSNFLDYVIDNKPKLIKISEYIGSDTYSDHKERIIDLANEIINNKEFEPIVVEPNKKYVIEGQHRIRAMKYLGFKTILAYFIIEKQSEFKR